jgi:hypothetical protein
MNPRPNGPAGAATPPEVYVATTDIRAAIKGRETDLLDALGIPWRDARPRINCPYPDHPDKDPSWRWDKRKRRAICTCGSDSILNVLMKIEAIDFDEAKLRAVELLNRSDLIRATLKNKRRKETAVLLSERDRNSATPAGLRLPDAGQRERFQRAALAAVDRLLEKGGAP